MDRETADSILKAIDIVGKDVSLIKAMVSQHDDDIKDLKKIIHGTSNPPPAVGGSIPIVTMAKRGSEASFELEEIRGQIMAVKAELISQSSVMGIGKKGLDWIKSNEGRNTMVRIATLLGVMYAAFKAALMHQ